MIRVSGQINAFDPITDGLPEEQRHPVQLTRENSHWQCHADFPETARALPILGPAARLTITITDRDDPAPG
jgi:hypothetical protein